MMRERRSGMANPVLLTYPTASPKVKAFSTTRCGGVSEGEYGSFNINPFCGDAPQAVQHNTEALTTALQICPQHLILPHQVHGIEVRQVAEDFFGLSPYTQQLLLDGVDAVITSVKRVCIGVSTADCIPVLLYEPKRMVAGAVHAGWRGTLQRITQKTITEMRAAFHIDIAALHAIIGPGISTTHFEVGQEVYDQVVEAGFDLTDTAEWKEKWHINLVEMNRKQLVEAGIPATQIHCANRCTYDEADMFFSARRQGTASGRIYTGILLND